LWWHGNLLRFSRGAEIKKNQNLKIQALALVTFFPTLALSRSGSMGLLIKRTLSPYGSPENIWL
jgi:hypothetical protein